MIKASRTYYINGQKKIGGVPNDFTYEIQVPNLEQFTHVVLMQANIPSSYYIVSSTGSSFTLTENGTSILITIPIGNYTATSFMLILKNLLTQNSPRGYNYNITYPNPFTEASSGKYTYTVSGNGAVQPSFTFDNEIYEQCGFAGNGTYTFSSNTLVSNAVVKFIPEDTIYLHSDIVEGSVLQDIYNQNHSTFSNIVYICPSPVEYSKKLRTNNSNIYKFSLTDEHNRPIDLNNLNPNFTLMLFKVDDFTDVFKQYIKYSLLTQ